MRGSVAAQAFVALCLASPAAEAQWPRPPRGVQPAPYNQPAPYASPQAGAPSSPAPVTVGPAPGALETEQLLDDAKQKDAGRGLEWAYLDVQGGFQHLGLTTFKGGSAFVAGVVPTSQSAGLVSAGLGARLIFFTVGGRGRIAFSGSGRQYSVGGEGGLRIPLGNVEPHIEIGGGYTAFDQLSTPGGPRLDIGGAYARAGGGINFFLVPMFSLGAEGSADLLFLQRSSMAASAIQAIKDSPSATASQRAGADRLAATASGIGGALAVSAVVGLHF